MNEKISLYGLKGIPLIQPGDDIPSIIIEALEKSDLTLENDDILVIAQTIVSKSSNRMRNLTNIKASPKAIAIYEKITPQSEAKQIPIKEPELVQAILDESKQIIKAEHVLITETKHGFICANAGIDKSNVGSKDQIALLPEDSDEEARKIRNELKKITGKDTAVIISDSFGRAFRVGATGVAIGVAGIEPILDKRGSLDLFQKVMKSTIVAQIDNLASASQLIMGETNEGLPIVLIRGYEYESVNETNIKKILRAEEDDLFRGKPNDKELVSILKNRRSYKLPFEEQTVNREQIMECIEVARWAPSAHNSQPWRYIFIQERSQRQKLIDNMNEKLKADLEADGKTKSYIQRKVSKTRANFIDAPELLLLCLDKADLQVYPDSERSNKEFLLGVQSISASITYLLIALQIKGLAACWYCAPLFSPEVVLKTLNLPENYAPMAFITVGCPKKSIKAPKRRSMDEIIHEL